MPPASTSVTEMETDEDSATKQKIAKLEEKLEKLEQTVASLRSTVSTIEGPNPDYASLRSDQLYLALRTDLASLNQQVATLQVERCKYLVVLSVAAAGVCSVCSTNLVCNVSSGAAETTTAAGNRSRCSWYALASVCGLFLG